MTDVEDDDDDTPDVRPDDPEEQRLYGLRMRARYPKELAGVSPDRLGEIVRGGLAQCPPLRIKRPVDVLRFLALGVLITPEQRRSMLLDAVVRRVLGAVEDWTPGKRLDFIYKHVVGRPPPAPEPDFGPWYVESPPPPPT
jgi:hypothetical protein